MTSIKPFVFLLMGIAFTYYSPAQHPTTENKARLNKNIKTGRLKNGFEYYLKKTKQGAVYFNFVVKAGFAQEEKTEVGVAHLLEHLPNAKTQNFEDGVRYFSKRVDESRYQFNASASVDHTYFFGSIPSKDDSLFLSLLRYYRDVAHDADLSIEQINKQKAIILEESRMSEMSLDGIITSDLIKTEIMTTKRDADISRIDPTENTQILNYEDISNFYEKWYQPERQAVIIVGNIDLISAEKAIEVIFGDLKTTQRYIAPRHDYDSSRNFKSKLSIIASDKINGHKLSVTLLKPYRRIQTERDLPFLVQTKLFNALLLRRFHQKRELNTNKSPIIIQPLQYQTEYPVTGPKLAGIDIQTSFEGSQGKRALDEILSEIESIKRFGFTDAELEGAKKALLREDRLFSIPSEKELVERIRNYCVAGEFVIDEGNFIALRSIINSLKLHKFNKLVAKWLIPKDCISITFLVKDSTGMQNLNDDEIWAQVKGSQTLKVNRVDYSTNSGSKIQRIMTSAEVARLKRVPGRKNIHRQSGVITLSLPNGIEVFLKNQTSPEKMIQLKSVSYLPSNALDTCDTFMKNQAHYIIYRSGVKGISFNQLQTFYESNGINFLAPYGGEELGAAAAFSSKNLENVLQILYSYSTDPRVDSVAFNKAKESARLNAKEVRTPGMILSDTIKYYVYPDKSKKVDGPNCLDSISPSRVQNYFLSHFAATNATKFILVGDYNIDSAISLIEKYLGNIPLKEVKYVQNVTAEKQDTVTRKIMVLSNEIDRSEVRMLVEGRIDNKQSSRLKLSILVQYLSSKLYERLRVQEGGVYGVSTGLSYSDEITSNIFNVGISFTCAFENTQRLIDATKDEINKVVLISDADFYLLKEKAKLDAQENIKLTDFWLNYLTSNKVGLNSERNFDEPMNELLAIDSLTIHELRGFASNLLSVTNVSEYVLTRK